MERVVYKPKLGTRVYCIYCRQGTVDILTDTITFIGEDSFLLRRHPTIGDKLREWRYEDFGETWFESLREAQEEFSKLPR